MDVAIPVFMMNASTALIAVNMLALVFTIAILIKTLAIMPGSKSTKDPSELFVEHLIQELNEANHRIEILEAVCRDAISNARK